MLIKSKLKKIIFPNVRGYYRIPFGLGRGNIMSINFDHQTLLYLGLYEKEISKHILQLLKTSSNCFDIGANSGYYSLIFAKHTKGKVLAVEPDTNSFATLKANFSQNPYNISCLKSFVKSKSDNASTTLDALMEQYFIPDLIKMDIEGGELSALKGAQKLLSNHAPHIIIEVHSEDLDYTCQKYLKNFGYQPKRIAPRKVFGEKRPSAYNGWLICQGGADN